MTENNFNNEGGNMGSPIQKLLAALQDNLQRSSQVHLDFLKNQAQALQSLAANAAPVIPQIKQKIARLPIINKWQLQEFGTGSIANCFGPEYAPLDQRKTPRIPNGDLLMIDRVLEISGQRGNLNPPAYVLTEYDVPADAWYLNENIYPGIPIAVLMEIALQPCGILSAYLGTSLYLPADVNIFRNLDGDLTFHAQPELAGKTISNRAHLLNSVASSGMLIQKYAFELSVDGVVFIIGESSFGYFRQAAMDNQAGLDGKGSSTVPVAEDLRKGIEIDPVYKVSQPEHLRLLDNLYFIENGGIYHKGLITGEKTLNGSEWFYTNHFFQDPVMPGSLGVEAILQGMWAYIRRLRLTEGFSHPVMDFSADKTSGRTFTWKYRGQVIPANRKINFRIQLKESSLYSSLIQLLADAEFWVDNLKIYSINNISLTLREGQTP